MTPDQIKTIRKKAGWTQDQLARKLRVSRVTVARWEAGTRTPGPHTIWALQAKAWLLNRGSRARSSPTGPARPA